ncbi:MAG: SHOCT domain-containing protein [Actinomycetota bacterium]|nr:SHOCT domain-containing protein [Actinomycetota bacterium]
MTEISLVQVTCPDCRRRFDVPDGAPEAQCPQCKSEIVWRSCLDTGEVFTVLRRWETWLHPNCNIRHVVDLSQVIPSPGTAPSEPSAPTPQEPAGYVPTELAPDVDWADQAISGRFIVDSDRLAVLPGEGALRPPLSVAWLRDVLDYSVRRSEIDDGKKPKRFGRGAKKAADSRPSVVLLTVTGGQITLTASLEPDIMLAQLDQHLRPRLVGAAHQVARPTVPVPPTPNSQRSPVVLSAAGQPVELPSTGKSPAHAADEPAVKQTTAPAAPIRDEAAEEPVSLEMPDLEPDTPEGVYESIRKLAELAVVGAISSEEFAEKKAGLLARL